MSATSVRPARRWRVRPASFALVLVTTALLGFLSGFPAGLGIYLAAFGAVIAGVLRADPQASSARFAPLPLLGVLLVEAVAAPVSFGTEVVAGFAGLAFLVWLADDPDRPVGGVFRALPSISVPALAVGIAWASALFLPSGSLPLGLAGALLTVAIVAVAYLVTRPEAFDREPP